MKGIGFGSKRSVISVDMETYVPQHVSMSSAEQSVIRSTDEDDDDFDEDMYGDDEQKPGFFKAYHLGVLKRLSNDDLLALDACRNDEERLVWIHSLPYVHQMPADMAVEMTKCCLRSEKSAAEAQQKRTQGNEAFKVKDYQRAVRLYTEAVLKAPVTNEVTGEPELAMALANRSAALVHLDDHARALIDIEQALSNGYPSELHYKLAERRTKCLMVLGKPDDQVTAACESALKCLDKSRLEPSKRRQFESDIQKLMDNLRSNPQTPQETTRQTESTEGNNKLHLPAVEGGRNAEHPSLSSKIRVEVDDVMGRYCVARSRIRVGEVLAVDSPCASVIIPLKYETHCHHCFQPLALGAALPCLRCSRISFCSSACRSTALETYHAIECPILGCLNLARISITCYLALRMIALHPPSFFEKIKLATADNQIGVKQTPDAANDEQLNKYLRTYQLVTHGDRRNKESYFHLTLMADFLLKCLKIANYFGTAASATATTIATTNGTTPTTTGIIGKLSDPLSDQERWIGSLLLRHAQLLQFNAHEISELQMDRPGCIDGIKSKSLGAAIFPMVSLFNHSCEPGIVRYFIGNTMVIKAIKGFAEGDEINENYGPIFTQKSREKRQQTLKQRYWFDCRCQACLEYWPLIDQLTADNLRFRCAEARCRQPLIVPVDTLTPFITCPSCKRSNNILKSLQALQDTEESFNRSNELLKSGDFKGALASCIKTLTKLDEILYPPYRDFIQCQEIARKCILTQGNVVYRSQLISTD